MHVEPVDVVAAGLLAASRRTRRMTSTERRAHASAAGIVRALLVHARQAVEHVGDIRMDRARFRSNSASASAASAARAVEARRPSSAASASPWSRTALRSDRRHRGSRLRADIPLGHNDPQQQCRPPCSSISAEATSAFDTATDSTPASRMRAAASASSAPDSGDEVIDGRPPARAGPASRCRSRNRGSRAGRRPSWDRCGGRARRPRGSHVPRASSAYSSSSGWRA